MPRESEKDRVTRWVDRVASSDKVYTEWETRFHCQQAYNYYEGYQWAGETEDRAKDAYTINLIFPTIEIQLPSLLFFNPKVVVTARPAHADDKNSMAPDRAKLAEDTLQTFVDDPNVHFKMNTLLSLRDAEFRFGMVEVGYSADWIDNPNAGKPLLKEGTEDPITGSTGEAATQPDQVPKEGSERLYVKRIPPENVRVSLSGRQILTENDWVGYKEWHYVEDVKANQKYANTAKLKAGGTVKDGQTATDTEQARHRGMVCLWKLWDLRAKMRIVFAEGHEKFLLEEPYTYLPLAGLKFFERNDGWYPIPPTSNWLDPQDEINEIRESRKVHRQRFYRRYTYMSGSIDETELEKLESGEDGVYAKANNQINIVPVQDAPLGPDTDKDLAESRDDFMQITGVGAEARGQAESETATQANIIDVHARIRESASRTVVGEWLGEIVRLMLLTLTERMQLPFWIQIHQDPFAGDLQGAAQTMQTWQDLVSVATQPAPAAPTPEWKKANAKQLENLSVDVKIDVSSLSPVTEQQQGMQWNQVLALMMNPQLQMLFAMSEPLLKKTLAINGVKNPAEIREIQSVMKNLLMMQLAAQAQPPVAGAGGKPGATSMPSPQPQQPAGMPAAHGPIQ